MLKPLPSRLILLLNNFLFLNINPFRPCLDVGIEMELGQNLEFVHLNSKEVFWLAPEIGNGNPSPISRGNETFEI